MPLRLASITRLWIYLLIAIPVLPKVQVLGLAGVPILLDDFVLASCVCCGILGLLGRASVTGQVRIRYTAVSVVFLSFCVYKAVAFLGLALVLPWTRSAYLEKGVLISEGGLVIAKTLFFFLAYSVVLKSLQKQGDGRKALRFMVLCMALTVVAGLWQFFILDHYILTSTFRNIHEMSIPVPGHWEYEDPWFQNAAVGHEHFGAFLILALSLLAGMVLCGYPGRRHRRFLIGLLWCSCIFCLVYTASRGAWIGAVCALSVLAFWLLWQGKILQLLAYGLCGPLGFVGLLVYLDLDVVAYMTTRVEGLLTVTSGEITDVSAIDRIETLQWLWGRFQERPFWGWGAGGAGRIAEGQYIREMVEGGVVGWVLFMALLLYAARIAQRHYRLSSDPLINGCNLGLIGGIAGLAGQAMFTELFILTKVGTPFWVLVAIVQSLGLKKDVQAQ
jgi:hypothetical protein